MDMRVYVLTNTEKEAFHRFCASLGGREVLIAAWGDVTEDLTQNVSNALAFHMEHHPNEIALVCRDSVEFRAIEAFEERTRRRMNEGAGIISPLLTGADDNSVVMAGTTGGFPRGRFRTGSLQDTLLDAHESHLWLPFFATAFNPDMLRETGLPDRRLRRWFSDRDFCIRARHAGWPVLLDRLSRAVIHGACEEAPSNDEGYFGEQALFFQKWGGESLLELTPDSSRF